ADIDEEVQRLVTEAYQRAYDILKEHWDQVETVVAAIMEKETLTREVFERLMQGEDLASIEADLEAKKAAAAEKKAAADRAQQTPARPVVSERESVQKGKPPQPAMELE